MALTPNLVVECSYPKREAQKLVSRLGPAGPLAVQGRNSIFDNIFAISHGRAVELIPL